MRQAVGAVSRGSLTPLDDAGGDLAAVAQIDLVVDATDPGPDRLIRRSAVAFLPAMGYLQGTDHLSYRDQPQRPGAACACPFRGAKRGANVGRRQATSGDTQPWLVQLDGSSGHVQRRAAMERMRLKSGTGKAKPDMRVHDARWLPSDHNA
jgi:hypothetical protein